MLNVLTNILLGLHPEYLAKLCKSSLTVPLQLLQEAVCSHLSAEDFLVQEVGLPWAEISGSAYAQLERSNSSF